MRERNSDGKDLRRLAAGVALLAAAVALVWLSLSGNRERRGVPWPVKQQAVPARQDSAGSKADTARTATHAEDIAKNKVPLVRLPRHGHAAPAIDTGKKETISDTSRSSGDTAKEGTAEALDTATAGNESLPQERTSNNCAGDTLAPYVYPEPSGGLHRGPLTVSTLQETL